MAAQQAVAGPPVPKEPEYDENGEIIGGPRTHQQIAAQKRMQQTKAQVDEVVDIMKTNYEKVLERDVKLSELDDRADALEYGASQFEQQAKSLKNKFWLQNLKMMLIMGAIGLVIIGLLYVRYSGSSPVSAVTGGGAAPAGGVAAAPAGVAAAPAAGVAAAPVDNAGGTPAPSHFRHSGSFLAGTNTLTCLLKHGGLRSGGRPSARNAAPLIFLRHKKYISQHRKVSTSKKKVKLSYT